MNQNENIIKVYDDCALIYEEKFMDQKKYADSLNLFAESLTENARILDIACGPGNLTRYLLNQKPQLDVIGIDLADNMISLAKKNNPTSDFRKMDARKIKELNVQVQGIICGFGLPYLSKSESIKFINDAHSLLTMDGAMYLSAIIGDYVEGGTTTKSSNGLYEMNIYHHEQDYLMSALEKLDMSILYHKISETIPTKNNTKEMVVIAKKKDPLKSNNNEKA